MSESGWRSTAVEGKVHDVDEGRHEIAVDFPFDVLDAFRTDWRPGVWDEDFRSGWKPPMVWNHKSDLLIGSTRSTERLPDAQRMIGRFSRFDEQQPWTSLQGQAYQQALDGEIPGYSFHYQQAESEPHRSVRRARSFVKAHMAEWGPTAFPAIPGAVAVGIRSQEDSIMPVTLESLLAMRDRGDLDEDGFRNLVGEHYPEVASHLVAGRRKVTLQSIPHEPGESLYHEPSNPSDGSGRRPDQHANELASRQPGSPTIDEILALKDKRHIDDDGVHALIKQHYPHLADHFKHSVPGTESEMRSFLTKTFGEEAVRGMAITMPKAGNAVLGGSHDQEDDDGDDDAERELIQMIDTALEEAEKMSADHHLETRSADDYSRLHALVEAAHVGLIELADIRKVAVGTRSAKVSDEAWDGDASRFTPEQYRSACLIDTGEGKEDSKERYHLPVREPDGTLNRKAVHAAAGALAGARSDLNASEDQKRTAARKLVSLYGQLGERPTPTILRLAGKGDAEGGRSEDEVDPTTVEEAFSRIDRRRRAG